MYIETMIRLTKHLFIIMLISVLASAQDQDNVQLLNTVTVYDKGNPALQIWKQIRSGYVQALNQTPENIVYYSRKSNTQTGEIDFEMVSRVDLSESVFQEVLAFENYNRPSYAGNGLKVSLQAQLTPTKDITMRDRGELVHEAQFENAYVTPLENRSINYSRLPLKGLLTRGTPADYSIQLIREYTFEGQDFATLSFAPKSKGVAGWTATMEVNVTRQLPVHVEAQIIEPVLIGSSIYSETITFSQDVPFYIQERLVRDEDSEFIFRVTDFNIPWSKGKKPKLMVAQLPDREPLGEEYWSQYRKEDQKLSQWASKRDSLIRYLNSDTYLDSVDGDYNKFHWYEPIFTGIGYRKRSAGNEFYLAPLISMAQFGVGGERIVSSALVSKKFSDHKKIHFAPSINYGVRNKDLRGGLYTRYTYAPLHNGTVSFNIADQYEQITQEIDLAGLFARGNYVRKKKIEAHHQYEWFNGFYTNLGLEYSQRSSIEDMVSQPYWDQLFGVRNQPEPFETYTVSQLSLSIMIRPYQRYYLKGREKIVLSSRWPEFNIGLKQGIPGLFGGDVRYTKFNVDVEDQFMWTDKGLTFYRFSSGGFLNDPATIRYLEYKWFRGGDYYLFTHPFYTYQSLPSTFASAEPYFTGYLMHHFDGLVLSNIPVVRRLSLGTALSSSFLYLPNRKVSFVEMYLGLEKKVTWWKQPIRYGVYRSLIPNDQPGYSWKFGIAFKNTFFDKWEY